MRLIRFLAAFVLALAAASGAAAEIAGPQFSAASLRAARHAAVEPQLRLVFDLHRGDAAPVRLTILLGSDYLHMEEGGRETLYDFRLRRRLSLDRQARVFASFSLYGDVAFRRFELGKRVTLAEMYGSSGPDDPPPLGLQPFWLESDLGLASGAKPPPKIEHETLPDGAVRFRLGREEVALFAPASEAVPAELRKSFARFLRMRLPIHPDILAAIALDGRLPQRLVLVSVGGGERHPLGLVLRAARLPTGDYPLPADFEPRPLAGQATDTEALSLRNLMPLMIDAASVRRGTPRPLAAYQRGADEALERGQGFVATLLLAEAALQYGRAAGSCGPGLGWATPCRNPEEFSRNLSADPRAVQFYRAQTAEPKDPAAAAALWDGLKHDDVANGYVVDAFLADRLSASGHRDAAMGAFSRALEGNPYLVGVYKELGDHFLRASRTDLAWICYDLGRALPGRSGDDSLADVDALETELAARYPEFF